MKKWFISPAIWFLLFLTGVFIGLTIVFNQTATIMEQGQLTILDLQKNQARVAIEDQFESITVLLDVVAKQIILSNDDAELLTLLVQIDQEKDFIASLYFGRPDKSMINSTGFVPGPGFDLTMRPWYLGAISEEGFSFSNAFVNASQDRVIVVVSRAIYLDGVLQGVIAADIDIRSITDFMQNTVIGQTGFVFLYDQNQSLIAYPNLNYETVSLDHIDTYEPSLSSLSGSSVKKDVFIQGVRGVLSYTWIASENYLLGAFMPMDEFSATYQTLFILFLIMAILTATSGLILLFNYQRRFHIPLQHLIHDIEAIDLETNLHYRLPEIRRSTFQSVRQALNRGLDTSASYVEARNQSEHQLLMEHQRVFLLMESTADIIFEINTEKVFVSVYGTGLQILKMKAEDFIGKTVLDIFGEAGTLRDQMYSKALQGERCIYDWNFEINGVIYYFESTISPMFDESKTIIGAVGVSRDISEPMRKQKEIEYINEHDFLTGIYNRRYFETQLDQKNQPKLYPLGIMMIDVNGLKIFNDAYGHNVGDQVLIRVANKIQEHISSKDILSRIGGDEFALLVTNTTEEEMQLLKEMIQNIISIEEVENVTLSVAVGYCIKTDASMGFEEVVKISENMMYRNKITEGKSIRNNAIKAIMKTLTDKYLEEKIHSTRVSMICRQIGEALNIRSDDLKELEMAGLFHDIGKISIPDAILDKPGKLTEDEYKIIKAHTENGYHILRAADEYSNIAEYALSHHEHWDGLGYPQKRKGEEIPLFSRIICIADAYEAMTSDRVYRKRLSKEVATKEIIRCAGTQFDPNLAKLFVEKVLGEVFE
ncbi:MAG: diguanylate cyclase [bacterium]|nr:diguanylate cyclase [bacterium]